MFHFASESVVRIYSKDKKILSLRRNKFEPGSDLFRLFLCPYSFLTSIQLHLQVEFSKLNADINELRIQNEAVSRIAIDSLSRKYEALINYQVTEKMLDLHLSQVEHEYTSITIWAAVLTIIFLIFSFYSLFKIEQSREEIRQLTIRGKETSEYIASQLQYQNNSINNQVQTAVSNLSGLKEEYESKIEELNSRLQAINVKESSVQPKMEE